jgi:hypothetical protein
MSEHIKRMGVKRNACMFFLVRKLEGKTPLGRPRCRWFNNIKVDLLVIGWMACTGLVWLRIGTG